MPYIDEHRTAVGATPDRTWEAVVELARGRHRFSRYELSFVVDESGPA